MNCLQGLIVSVLVGGLAAGCASAQTHQPVTDRAAAPLFDEWGRLTSTGAGATGIPPHITRAEIHGAHRIEDN